MPSLVVAGRAVDVDTEGFLSSPRDWTPEVAEAFAREAQLELGPRHWTVLNFAREDHAAQGVSPGPRRIVTQTDVTMKELYQLFPRGPGKLVAKLAGIPKPKACL